MASRISEASYWGPQQLPQGSQYSSHYYSSSPATSMMNQQQQQQPRQAPPPLNHSSLNNGGSNSAGMEGQSGYSSAPPSSSPNAYYGNFYPAGQMNGGSNGSSAGAGTYGSIGSVNNGSHASQGGQHGGPSSNGGFMSASHNQAPLSASHMASSPYPPMNGGHSSYHLSNNGVYLRSHPSELEGGMPQSMEGMHHHHHASHQQQQQNHPFSHHQQHAAYHSNSQHSGSPTLDGSEYGPGGMKPKRRQVKNACINCQKACKRCDEGRPCSRCVKYGLTDTCQDSARKERKRGIKRGPYKRRATTGSQPASAPSTSTSHFPSSSFAAVDSLYSSASPHLRRGEEPSSASIMDGGHGVEHGMLNSPVYPSSAPGTIQRSTAPLASHEGPYGRMGNMANEQSFQAMQPPRFTSRYEYERNGTSPGLPLYNSMGRGSNNLPPPISAPASSTSFASSGVTNPYASRGLFSPPSLLSASSANFLGSNGHNRLHSDSSLNTMATNTTQSSSLSPRTPMSMSANGSGSMNGELGLMSGQQSLSAGSNLSSPGGMNAKYGSGNNYVHHPGPTTTLNLPPTATGAFLNPPSTPSSNGFPLHIPPTVRWRGSQGSHPPSDHESKEEQLAPIKLSASGDSDMSTGTLSGRYQLPSPRMPDMSRGMDLRPGMPKMEHAHNIVA